MPNILRNAIIRLLDTANVPYDRYSHEPISSCESARIIREPLGIAAVWSKNLLFCGKHGFFLVATHADARIRAKWFRSITGDKDTRFATDDEATDMLDARSGSIPPLGFARADFAIFVDETILSTASYAFTPGTPDETIVLSWASLLKAFEQVSNPVYVFRESDDGYVIEPLENRLRGI